MEVPQGVEVRGRGNNATGKYYCDYCNKQFQDSPFARTRHIQGLQHLGAKALWYDSFKDPNQAHTETSEKVFPIASLTGVCQYGDSCKYFHPKNNLQNLNNQGMSDRMGVSWGNLPPSLKPPPAFVDWA